VTGLSVTIGSQKVPEQEIPMPEQFSVASGNTEISDHEFGRRLREIRKSRRVTQNALASIVDISLRHLSFLETGRSMPSWELVIKLLNALDVPMRDRNILLGVAGFAPYYRARPFTDGAMTPLYNAIEHMLESHSPYPAYVTDRLGYVLQANKIAETLFGMLAPGDERPNFIMMVLTPGPAREVIENWQAVAKRKLHQWQTELLRTPGDKELRDMYDIARMHTKDVDLPAEVEDEAVCTVELTIGGQKISVFSAVSTFGTAQDLGVVDLVVEHVFPANAVTESFLRSFAESL
jgi:transcriptional regulator with XRE-family HTH domain